MIRSLLDILVLLFPISEVVLGFSRRARHSASVSPEDRGSLRLLWIVIMVSVGLASVLSNYAPTRIHAPQRVIDALALALLAGGLVLRWASVIVLGRFFTVNVAILPGHRVIDTGPYRFVRHPSYSGLLLAFLGLGFYFMNWLSVLVLFVHIMLALLYRIRVEEAALKAGIGAEYAAYCTRTKRLVPGVL
jgi:protein-S-isoprenylcysteine O-methyltransferase